MSSQFKRPGFLQRITEANNKTVERDLRPYYKGLEWVRKVEERLRSVPDSTLGNLSNEARKKKGPPNRDQQLSLVALAVETCRRKIRLSAYDCQILGTLALLNGRIVEMKTGEGKTLTAAMAAIVLALSGHKAHILTFNEYLAKRDSHDMGAAYEFLGLKCDHVIESKTPDEKRSAYNSDITYLTAKQAGFDFLRNQTVQTKQDLLFQELDHVIVDEADALLIDEARNPLVLAGHTDEEGKDLLSIAHFVRSLNLATDLVLDEYARTISLADQGISKAETFFQIDNLYDLKHHEKNMALHSALHAQHLLRNGIDYVVKGGKVHLVDEFTGRIVEDRKWQNHLQSAVEAKENLEIRSYGKVIGSISMQHFIRNYKSISGMTGTALPSADEFREIYGITVTPIPNNRPDVRIDWPDSVFPTQEKKREALIQEVKEIHGTGRPILIGTLSVHESEEMESLFRSNGLPCKVLNAKNDEDEASIIAAAGKRDSITISTNMAGRGTDIVPEHPEGLHVIGTNRHESRRIDDQLRGRAGRQGDRGSSHFLLSLEDELMVRYRLDKLIARRISSGHEWKNIPDRILLQQIEATQRIIEGQMFDQRKNLFKYTSFVERQRKTLQNRREEILASQKKEAPALLGKIDTLWMDHLEYSFQLKEGVHAVRFGGKDPLHVFMQATDREFWNMMEDATAFEAKLDAGTLNEEDLKNRIPTSTWTYLVNDNPFGNQLQLAALDQSKLVFQLDFLAIPLLTLAELARKIRQKFTRTPKG